MRRNNPEYMKMLVEKMDERRKSRMPTYSGDYIKIALNQKDYKKFRISLFIMIGLIIVFQIAAGNLNNPGMLELIVVLPYIGALFSYVYFCLNLFQLPSKNDKFRFGEDGMLFNRIKMASIFLAISLAGAILGETYFLSTVLDELILSPDTIFLTLNILAFSLAILLIIIQIRIAKKIKENYFNK